MRLSTDMALTVSSDTAGRQIIAKRTRQLVDDLGLTEHVTHTIKLPGATNTQISLGGITSCKVVWVLLSGPAKLRTGELLDPLAVAPSSTGQDALYYAEAAHAELWLENEAASDIEAYIFAAGV